VQVVQLLGVGHLADVLQALETERILVVEQVLPGLIVEALRMSAVDVGHVQRQRAVDKNGDVGNALLVEELVQQEHELLGAAHGESRHDDASAAPRGAVHDVGELVDDVADILVKTPAVGALHDQVFGGRHAFGIADDGQVRPANISGKAQAHAGAPDAS